MSYNRHKEENKETTRNRLIYVNGTLSSTLELIESYDYRRMWGVDLPDYYSRLKRGDLLPLTDWLKYTARGETSMSYSLDYQDSAYTQTCNWTPIPGSYLPTTSELHRVANLYDTSPYVQQAASDIYSSGWDGLTFAAEFTQVIAMFKNIVQRMIRLLARGELDKIWLEARYGWRTLLYDMNDLADLVNNVEKRTRFKESSGSTFNYTESKSEVSALGGACTYTVNVTDTYVIGLRGTVVADIEPPSIVINPIVTAWELTTLSFVIDWVINVGNALGALSFRAISGNYVAAGGHSVELTRVVSIDDVTWSTGWTGSCDGYGTFVATWVSRTPASIPYLPQLLVNLNLAKVFDLLAILRQLIQRR